MSLQIANAELRVFEPSNHSMDPDFVVDADLDHVDLSAETQRARDDAKIVLNNGHGRYATDTPIRPGYRVEFWAQPEFSVPGYGASYGELFGIGAINWSGFVQPREFSRSGPNTGELSLECSDYVSGVLANRQVTQQFLDEDIGAIVRNIVAEVAPEEIDASYVADVGETTDVFYRQADAWDAIVELANRADAILAQRGMRLVFQPVDEFNSILELTGEHKGTHAVRDNPDLLANNVRVDSGQSHELEEENTTVDTFERVTSDTYLTTQVRARKSQIARIDIYTENAEGDNDQISVRIQADEGGQPKAVGDRASDITRKTLAADFLSQGDWTTFYIPDHVLPDRDPWLILESGEDGQNVGVDVNGNLAYRTHYPFPLNVEVSSGESIRKYRQRDNSYERQLLDTFTATRDFAEQQLEQHQAPRTEFEFPAESLKAHSLEPADTITVDEPRDGATGEHIVTRTSRVFDGSRLTTTVTAQEKATL